MSDPQGGVLPVETPAAPPAVAPVATTPAAQPQAPPGQEPGWLTPRLERERDAAQRAVLTQLGVTSIDEAKTRITAGKAAEDASRTQGERDATRIRELEQQAAAGTAATQAVQQYATRELAALNDQQRAAVTAIAGNDHARILTTIESLRPTWATQTTAEPEAQTQQIASATTTTAPPATQPAPTTTTSPPDRRAQYEQLKKTNPQAAGVFLNRYSSEIYPHS